MLRRKRSSAIKDMIHHHEYTYPYEEIVCMGNVWLKSLQLNLLFISLSVGGGGGGGEVGDGVGEGEGLAVVRSTSHLSCEF